MDEARKQQKNIVSELEQFHHELKEYKELLEHLDASKTIMGHEIRARDALRERLVRKTGTFKGIIIEVTGKQYFDMLMKTHDMWGEALSPVSYPPLKMGALALCINATNEAIGKLEAEIKTGIRDEQGNVIEKPQRVDMAKSIHSAKDSKGSIVGDEFQVILQGTVDMTIELIVHFTKELNSRGYSYKSDPRIGGHPDYAKPDRTCFATCAITETTDGTENQIGIIKLQLLPKERTLLKTSPPEEWDSSFKYFLDALFAKSEQLGYIKEEKTAIVSGSQPKALIAKANWKGIEDEFGITKKAFGRAINFVSDDFRRKIIFRDVEHAYLLASHGFSKPAVILAGSVIEELLRLYLEHKQIKPIKNDFDGYIQTCEEHRLLKDSVSRLSHSIRQFRNLVHLSAEETKRYTISKSTAKGAVASIFTIANDF